MSYLVQTNPEPASLVYYAGKYFIYLRRDAKHIDENLLYNHELFDIEKKEIVQLWGSSHTFLVIQKFQDCI